MLNPVVGITSFHFWNILKIPEEHRKLGQRKGVNCLKLRGSGYRWGGIILKVTLPVTYLPDWDGSEMPFPGLLTSDSPWTEYIRQGVRESRWSGLGISERTWALWLYIPFRSLASRRGSSAHSPLCIVGSGSLCTYSAATEVGCGNQGSLGRAGSWEQGLCFSGSCLHPGSRFEGHSLPC